VKAKFLVLSGDGINCERETARAFELTGMQASIVHVNDLVANPSMLSGFQGMAFPGGFSFGDELGSGQLLSLKITRGLSDEFARFVERGALIIGICNGFQVLTKMGLLPNQSEGRSVGLARNDHGQFLNRWVHLDAHSESICVWTHGIETGDFSLPVRHGEGRIVLSPGSEQEVYSKLVSKGQIALSYREDINGSYQRIAGLCDPSGRIFGLMPHPEAAFFDITHTDKVRHRSDPGPGQKIFTNARDFLAQS
jgi:phosphoribosylformylglycinamidine synthase